MRLDGESSGAYPTAVRGRTQARKRMRQEVLRLASSRKVPLENMCGGTTSFRALVLVGRGAT